MLWYDFLIVFYIFTHIAALIIGAMTGLYADNGFAWINPLFIYRNMKVNWFGASLLALIANVSIPCYAIIYWIYKLCIVGRK